MKNLLVTASVFLMIVFSHNASAQNISVGPTVGFGHSFFTYSEKDAEYERSFHPAFNAGAMLVYSANEHWGIGVNALYSAEGESGSFAGIDIDDVNLSYFRIPVKAIYFFGDYGQSIRPKAFVGIQPGFLLSAKVGDIDFKDELNGFDIGAHIGAGVNIELASGIWLNTDITYSHGFADITKDENDGDRKVGNSSLMLNVGVAFGIGK